MKVCLTAFNRKLFSDFMDWPENTGHDIFLALDMEMPPLLFDTENDAIPRITKKARFQSTDRHFVRGRNRHANIDLWMSHEPTTQRREHGRS